MKKLLILISFLAAFAAVPAYAACVDHGVFDKILKANVDKEGTVDYDSIRINKGGDLYEYISSIEAYSLKGCTQSERLAFWVNAYNAHVIRLVLARPALKMANEDLAMFDEKFDVGRINLSLNDIHHRILRSDPQRGGAIPEISISTPDARVAFALVNGSKGSPRLLNRAYQAGTIESDLQNGVNYFANSPRYLRMENGILKASYVLQWYEKDFISRGGVAGMLMAATDTALRKDAHTIDNALKTDFPEQTEFFYDWSLNKKKVGP